MKKDVAYFEDVFGYNVRVGDRIIYYSGKSGALKTSKVKRIRNDSIPIKWSPFRKFLWEITLESGSVIQNPNITMKDVEG